MLLPDSDVLNIHVVSLSVYFKTLVSNSSLTLCHVLTFLREKGQNKEVTRANKISILITGTQKPINQTMPINSPRRKCGAGLAIYQDTRIWLKAAVAGEGEVLTGLLRG